MKKLVIHNENIIYKEVFIRSCPFGALEIKDGVVIANASCNLCGSCVLRNKNGEVELITE